MKPDTTYSTPAVAMHWLAAILIVCAVALGLYMTSLQISPLRLKLYNWHKWLGVTVLALSAARLLWRLAHRPPERPALPRWQRAVASAVHWALYALFFGVPLAGWAYSSASGFPVVVFGVLPLPDFVGPDKALAKVLRDLHATLAMGLGLLVVVHVAAVAKHQLWDRDRTLHLMLPRFRGGQAG
jgi:cytochrome b561